MGEPSAPAPPKLRLRRFSFLVAVLAVSVCVHASSASAATAGAQSYGDQVGDAVKGPIVTVVKWLVYALLIIGAVWVLVLIRRLWRLLPARHGTVVALEDLVADVKERQAASHVLSRQLLTEISSLGSAGGADIEEIDETSDLDRTFVANLRIAGEGVENLDSLMQGETAVSVGPVRFSLRQVAYYLGSLFRRRSEFELVGSLTKSRDRVVLTVENRGAAGQVIRRWHSTRTGDYGVADAVRDVAMQIVVGLGLSTATSDWRSFRDYREALDVLGTAGDAAQILESRSRAPASCSRARSTGTRSTRLRASTSRRSTGSWVTTTRRSSSSGCSRTSPRSTTPPGSSTSRRSTPSSAEWFATTWLRRSSSSRHGARNVRRCRCSTGSSSDWPRLGRNRLPTLRSTASACSSQSALAWALTFRLERELQRDEPDGKSADRRSADVARLISEIKKTRGSIQDSVPATTRSRAVYASALATAENAFGRASNLLGRQKDALEAYRRAATLLPDLVDAQLNLVELLLGLKELGWQAQAEAAICQVLRVDPSNERAEYLYGRLCADPSVARYKEAEEHLTRAGSSPEALFLHAQILAEQDDDLPAALALLDRAIALAPAPGHRLLGYVNFVLELAKKGDADRELLLKARERADRLATDGISSRFRRRGVELIAELDEALNPVQIDSVTGDRSTADHSQPGPRRPAPRPT